uniref:Uncharacterized protein n=1 Tax=Solanum lycopersicum TaxID=4081 RepID=A0A3Q7HCR4_SOLLC
MRTLQCMCYAYLMYFTLYSWGMVMYASVPSIGLLFDFQVYPEVHDPWFAVYVIAFISTILENMSESIPEGGSVKTWWMEYRALMMMGVSAIWLGGLKAIYDKIVGTQGEKLYLSDKAIDKEKLKKYEKGKFDFQGIGILALPLIAFSVLNLVGFIVGKRGSKEGPEILMTNETHVVSKGILEIKYRVPSLSELYQEGVTPFGIFLELQN